VVVTEKRGREGGEARSEERERETIDEEK